MKQAPRYALEREGRGRFAPVVGDQVGFDSPEAAMLHALEVMPEEAHLWSWAPIHVLVVVPPTTK